VLVAIELHRNAPNWRLQRSCPRGQYKLEDDEPLEYGLLLAMDGGNSLKEDVRRAQRPKATTKRKRKAMEDPKGKGFGNVLAASDI